MDKKIIFEEILRIHQLMDVDVLLNETFNKDNLVLEQGGLISSLVRLSTKFSDLVDYTTTIKNSRVLNPRTGKVFGAEKIPYAEELLQLVGKPDEFIETLKNFADEAPNTAQREVADEIINKFINKTHQKSADLRDLETKLNDLKSTSSGLGKSADDIEDELQIEIDELFYGKAGQKPLVKFNVDSLRDLYVYNLRKKLNLDTEWKRPQTVGPVNTITPQQIISQIQTAKKSEINLRYQTYKQIGKKLEKNSKLRGDKPPFKMPSIFKKSNFKKELQDTIKNAVDKQFGGRVKADAAKLQDWVNQLDGLTKQEKEDAIKLAANRITNQVNSRFEKLLKATKKRGIEIIQIQKRIKELPSVIWEFLKLLVKGNIKGATNLVLKKIEYYIYMFILSFINEFVGYRIRKYYDKDTALPLFYVGLPPIEGGYMDWILYFGKIVTSPIILSYDIFATIVNILAPATLYDDGNYKEKLEDKITYLKDEGILPGSQSEKVNANTLLKFYQKVVPKDKIKIFTGTTGVNFLTGLTDGGGVDLVNWDSLVGLPISQFYVNGSDIYFVNQNGRFEVKDSDKNDPYIEGKYDNEDEEEKVYIKKMFFDKDDDTINRFLVDFYPIDEQTKLLDKSSNYPKIIEPDDRWGNMQNKLKNAMGLVDRSPLKKNSLATSGIKNLDMDNIISYDFYNEDDIDEDPTKPGYYKPKNDVEEIVSRLFYVDRTGNKDDNGNYPVYRVQNSGPKPGDKFKPMTWYILKNNKIWVPLEDFLNNPNTQTTTNESPEQRWLSENSNGSFKKLNPNKPTTWLYYTEPNNQGDRYIYNGKQFDKK